MSEQKRWIGNAPEKCDLCGEDLRDIFVDGAIGTRNPFPKWGIMCPRCHEERGVGLGAGKGQAYDLETKLLVAGDPDEDDQPFANIRNMGKCQSCGSEIKVGYNYWACPGCVRVRVWSEKSDAIDENKIIDRLGIE